MKKLLLLLIILYPAVGYSQAQTPDKGIIVTGSADSYVNPDEASFNISVATSDSVMKEAKRKNDAKVEKILSAIKAEGINDRDIKTNYSFFNETYDYNAKTENRKKTYQSSLQLTFVLKDLSKYDEVAYKLIEAGVNSTSTQFNYSKTLQLKQQLRIEALKDARIQALAIANACKIHLGRILQVVDEASYTNFFNNNMQFKELSSDIQATNNGTKGQIDITAAIRVSYDIRP